MKTFGDCSLNRDERPRLSTGAIGQDMKRIVEQKPAYCARWSEELRQRFLARVGG